MVINSLAIKEPRLQHHYNSTWLSAPFWPDEQIKLHNTEQNRLLGAPRLSEREDQPPAVSQLCAFITALHAASLLLAALQPHDQCRSDPQWWWGSVFTESHQSIAHNKTGFILVFFSPLPSHSLQSQPSLILGCRSLRVTRTIESTLRRDYCFTYDHKYSSRFTATR